jgi:hypothetical protein
VNTSGPRGALRNDADGASAEPIIICPYLEDSDVDEVRLLFNLDSPRGARLKFFFWKDEQRIGPERAYEHCWNQFPGRDIIIMHTDITPMPGDITNKWYDELLSYARSLPRAGMLACNLLYPLKAPDGSWIVQHAGGYFKDGKIGRIGGGVNFIEGVVSDGIIKYGDDLKKVRKVDWVNFGAVYIRAEALSRCGAFDRRYQWAYVMDVDYCFEARRKGFQLMQVPVNLLHYERRTTLPIMLREPARAAQVEENFRLFYEKWAQEILP